MHGRSCLKIPFDSQRVNESQTLFKSARQHFYPISSSSFWDKLCLKTFVLVRSDILGLFLKTQITKYKF